MAEDLVLGLGGTVDYETRWDAAVLTALAHSHGIRLDELTTTTPIIDERALVVTVLAFLATGGGGERFVLSSEIVERFAAHFETEITLGGTGVRAGIALDRIGVPTVQHLVSIDDNVRRLLPASMRIVSSATHDTLDPHLIVQYPEGATVALADGAVTAPASNRLIFANDAPNREMAIAHDLGDALADAAAFLVSGFNTMQDAALLERRLDDLAAAMRRLPVDALVYYEDAGFYQRELSALVRARLLDRIDVYGMNEDELQEYLARQVDLRSPHDVTAALAEVHALIPARALVVHTKYWAIAVGPAAARHREALKSAVRTAATRYRLGDACSAADVDDTARLPRHAGGEAVVRAAESGLGATGVPAFVVDTAHPTTIGLGDTFVGGFLAAVPSASRAATAAALERALDGVVSAG
ncbi:ADP-dependent phosphofructokinase/glucokinase [Microbacterium sp. SORGH_AS 1204]|uniref:ADP-dependent glucokinase/phosphofructokinase n=1 Tax=Microbacterium sp. SORGH_AS_1204 TaxID=3041785 RepID=UPI0027917B11|nr:ADP-dependent glucokinase/phosphofructokinase [Microbacterium sp. SORGH_AS_1204]MDQ1138053.1 ADP-dependent phosphofructokinase/glucokinase [Microbacterium sp. SORGH_AS_1204]